MDLRDSGRGRFGIRSLILPAVLVASLAAPAGASNIIFNPQGAGAGAGAISISGFGYATSSALALGLSSPGVPGAPNTTPFNLYYESVINATPGNSSTTIGPNYAINGSTNQFTVIAGFSEHIVSYDASGTITLGLSSTPAFSTSTTSPNFFEILANPTTSTVNPNTGNGANFGSGTPILTGYLVPQNYGGSFSVSQSNPTGTFNTSGLPTAITTPNTVNGGGGTQLTVVVNSYNPAYFPSNPVSLIFSTTNSLPFASVAPLSGFYSSPNPTPNITYPGTPPTGFNTGTTNGVDGNSLMFQTVATSSFAVPEPASLVLAVSAACLGLPIVLRARGRKAAKDA